MADPASGPPGSASLISIAPRPPDPPINTACYTMDRKKLVKQLKTRANDVQLMSKSVKDFDSNVLLTLFCSSIQPAFSSFTANVGKKGQDNMFFSCRIFL